MATMAAKKERGIAKGSVTRADKTLYGLIGRKRPLPEVKTAFQTATVVYGELESKHQEYLRTIDDPDAIEREDEWLQEFADKRDKWGDDVSDYAATFVPAPGGATAPPPPPPGARTHTLKMDLKVDRVEKPTFSGKVLDYFQFRKDFKFVYAKYSEEDTLYCLRKAVGEDGRKWLVAVNTVSEAWEILDKQYGDPRVISDAVLHNLAKHRPIPEDDSVKFANLFHQIRNAKNILGELTRSNDLDNSTTLATIESKLSYSDRMKWVRFQLEKVVDPSVDSLLKFMDIEMNIKRIAGAEIRNGSSGNHGNGSQKSGKVCAETAKLRNEAASSNSTMPFTSSGRSKAPPSTSGNASVSNREPPKCWVCAEQHKPHECVKFLKMSLAQRLSETKKNKGCFFCLNRHYGSCNLRKKCTLLTDNQPCKYGHHVLLHGAPFENKDSSVVTGFEGAALANPSTNEDRSLLPVIQGKISNPSSGHTIDRACVFIDTGATLSLIKESTARKLGLAGQNLTVTLGKVGATEEEFRTKLYQLRIQSVEGGPSYRIDAIGIPEICGEITRVDTNELARLFGLKPEQLNRSYGHPDVLIGLDFVKFHAGETIVKGDVALRKCPLGPVIFGVGLNEGLCVKPRIHLMQEVNRAPDVNLDDFWSAEEMGIAVNPCCLEKTPVQKKMTPVEKEEDARIRKSAINVGERWMIPIPWKRDPHELPDNYTQALARLQSTEKKLRQNDDYARMYQGQIDDLVNRGCARKLTAEEIETYKGPVFYLSHHAVLRPEKVSTPCRVVFNSAANFRGHCLNEYQCKGPNLLNSLLGVIMRFREKPIAIYGDISKMYHSILISPTLDANTHRFLWRDLENRPPDIYKKLVLTFGDKCSPAVANTALNLTAEDAAAQFPKAAEMILNSRYMDDIADSLDDEDEAKERTDEADKILEKRHFRIKEWTSNANLQGTKPDKGEKRNLLAANEKVLGICWDRVSDTLHIACNNADLKIKLGQMGGSLPPIMTKRMILSIMAGVFDVIGYVSPFLITAKIGLQKLWREKYGWDDDISRAEKEIWHRWFMQLGKLKEIEFERCLTPPGAQGRPILVISCDASQEAFGAVAHVRWRLGNGQFKTRFVMAKSKVAPLKALGIPKLEINSCVLGARLNHTIRSETRLQFEKTVLFTDSTIALAWMKSESRVYKPFVSVRVGEIQMKSDIDDWRHIPSEHNVADDVSRGLPLNELGGRWTQGSDFLRRPEEEWPENKYEIVKTEEKEMIEAERRKLQIVSVAVTDVQCSEDYVRQFSTLRKAITVTAMRDRFVHNMKATLRNQPRITGDITLEEKKTAERTLIREAQEALGPLLQKNALKNLSPTKDEHGIIVVKGRTRHLISYDTNSPPILPEKSWLSNLIVRHTHQNCGHPGIAACAAKVRRNYWILGVTRLAKKVKWRCLFCRKWEAKTEKQVMANLPLCRLQPHTPPFHNTSVDLFGPINVKISRNKTDKHYGVLFTCLMVRAVYIDLATDYSTEGFLMVLRRFFAIHGYPDTLWSDRGSQLVGADAELRRAREAWDERELKNFCVEKNMKWRFFTPTAAHQNGCAESMIRTAKLAIKRAIGEQTITALELQTVLFEISNLINSRPIGRATNDPDDGPYLAPNDLLLGRASTTIPQGPFLETKNPRHRYEFCQKIVTSWWDRWYRDVFPSLVPRKKWHQSQRNVALGDYVLVKDPNPIRGQWEKGVITEVFPGDDGRVRNVRVKTVRGKYERPITKIVVLHPVEGYDD